MAGISGRKFWLFAAAASAALVTEAAAQQAAAANEDIIVTATRREARLQDVPVAVTPITAQMIQNSGIRDVQDLTSVAPSLQFNVSENETSATARLRGIGTQGSNPGLESAVGIFVDGVYRARNGVALTDLGEISQVEVLRGPQGTLFGRNTSAGLISIRTAGPDLSAFGGDLEATYGNYNEQRLAGHITGPIVEDKLGFRLFGAVGKRDGFIDARYPTGRVKDWNNRDVWTVRGQLEFIPSDAINVRVIADLSERDEICCGAKVYNPQLLNGFVGNFFGATVPQAGAVAAFGGYGPTGLAALGTGDISDRFAFANRDSTQKLRDSGVSAEVNVDLGGAQLTSVTAYRDWTYDQGQDADFSGADLWYRPSNGLSGFDFSVWTQELRLQGDLGPVNWLVGGFYSDETLGRRDNLTNGSQFGLYFGALNSLFGALNNPALGATVANSFVQDRYRQEGKSLAFFTHNIWSIDDKTDLTIGLRYTKEEKDLKAKFFTSYNAQPAFAATISTLAGGGTTGATAASLYANCTTALPASTSPLAGLTPAIVGGRAVYCIPTVRRELDAVGYNQSRDENEWSGVVSARRDITDNASAYLSFSRGYKGGGFNLDRSFDFVIAGGAPNTSFPAELVDAYEFGVKTQWFGGDLLLNLATYYNEYTNFQLNTFNGVSFQVSSIPEVTSQGVELDAIWQTPVDGLSMQGGLAYVEAEYGDDSGWVALSRNPLNPAAAPVNVRLPGSRLTNAPLWTVTNAFTYKKSMFGDKAEGLAYLDFRYVSDQVTGSDLEPTKVQPGFFLVNARLGLSTADERWGIEFWGRNITDEAYQQIAFNIPLQGNSRGAFLGDPRTYGVTLKAKY
ncbi:MAG: TonB-dependent receptor [Alphaproteobacteria bacterium]|nr:TonB-dependent receptor [Alphaproteobacteria bacterium]